MCKRFRQRPNNLFYRRLYCLEVALKLYTHIRVQVLAGNIDPVKCLRNGTPQDVADAAAFLASDQAAWITGVVVDVAGGAVLV